MVKKIYILLIVLLQIEGFAGSLDSLKTVQYQQKDTVLFKTVLEIGINYYNLGQLDSSLTYFKKGYGLSVAAKQEKYQCNFLLRLGLVEREKGVYNKSSEYYYQALEIADKYDLKKQKASIYNGIAILASIQNDHEKAVEYYSKALEIYKKIDFLAGQSSIYNNIGLVYLDQKNNSVALKYFLRALEISKTLEDDFNMAINSENIGLIYHELNDYDLATIYYNKALKIWYKRHDENSIAINLSYIGKTFIKQKKWKSALDTLQKALELSDKINSIATQRDLAFHLCDAYEGANDPTNALKYYKLGKSLTDSIQNEEKTKEITEIQLNYAFNKIKVQDSIKHQMEVQVKENQLKSEKNYKYIISIVLLIISVLLFFVFKNYKEKTKANNIITEQKNLVEQKQQEILDSMIYARRIQTALLANKEYIDQNIKDHFILMKPKDIVSGDFYWSVKKDDRFYLAACDSTGHGVPGAFMSLLNMGFLNEALIEKQISQPNEIFNYVRERLINSIGDEGQQDGFDGILLCIDLNTKQITYSASNKSPIVVSRSGITILHSDKMPVGKGIRETPFNLYQLDLHPDDTLYLYTDGYADQFGGPKGKKFMYKQLNQLLVNISEKPMNEQRELLNNRFEEWKGDLEQVDDVLVVGIKI